MTGNAPRHGRHTGRVKTLPYNRPESPPPARPTAPVGRGFIPAGKFPVGTDGPGTATTARPIIHQKNAWSSDHAFFL